MTTWKLTGEERRELFRRFIRLQMQYVNQQVEEYLSLVYPDICIDDIVEDMPDIIADAFRERSRDPEVLTIMQDVYTKLKEKADGLRTDGTERVEAEK